MEGFIVKLNGTRVVLRYFPDSIYLEVFRADTDESWDYNLMKMLAIRTKAKKRTLILGYALSLNQLCVLRIKFGTILEYERFVCILIERNQFRMDENIAYASTICFVAASPKFNLVLARARREPLYSYLYMVEHRKNKKWYKSSVPIIHYHEQRFAAEEWIH